MEDDSVVRRGEEKMQWSHYLLGKLNVLKVDHFIIATSHPSFLDSICCQFWLDMQCCSRSALDIDRVEIIFLWMPIEARKVTCTRMEYSLSRTNSTLWGETTQNRRQVCHDEGSTCKLMTVFHWTLYFVIGSMFVTNSFFNRNSLVKCYFDKIWWSNKCTIFVSTDSTHLLALLGHSAEHLQCNGDRLPFWMCWKCPRVWLRGESNAQGYCKAMQTDCVAW